jgi:hypothetical protein
VRRKELRKFHDIFRRGGRRHGHGGGRCRSIDTFSIKRRHMIISRTDSDAEVQQASVTHKLSGTVKVQCDKNSVNDRE